MKEVSAGLLGSACGRWRGMEEKEAPGVNQAGRILVGQPTSFFFFFVVLAIEALVPAEDDPLRSEAAMSNFESTIFPGRCNSLLVEKAGNGKRLR